MTLRLPQIYPIVSGDLPTPFFLLNIPAKLPLGRIFNFLDRDSTIHLTSLRNKAIIPKANLAGVS
jgi:hypothetical protein